MKRSGERALLAGARIIKPSFEGRQYSETAIISCDCAMLLLETSPFPNQRNVRQQHVQFLANEIVKNRYDSSTTMHFGINEHGEIRVLDGQHRLWAAVETGKDVVNVVIWVKDTDSNLAKLYASLGAGLARSQADIMKALGVEDDLGLNKNTTARLGAAVRFIAGGMANDSMSNSVHALKSRVIHARAIRDWAPEAAIFEGIRYGCEARLQKGLMRSPASAIALVTLRYQRERAETFWRVVCRNDGLSKGDPCRTLVDYLMTHESSSAGYEARSIAPCWNAWFEGRELHRIMPQLVDRPITIVGTPYQDTGDEQRTIILTNYENEPCTLEPRAWLTPNAALSSSRLSAASRKRSIINRTKRAAIPVRA